MTDQISSSERKSSQAGIREEVLPGRHRRIPWRALTRQAGPALGDAPEYEAFRQLRDRAVVLEIERDRVETVGVVALTVEMIAVAGNAILVVHAPPHGEMLSELGLPPCGGDAQRVLEPRQGHRLAAERDLG